MAGRVVINRAQLRAVLTGPSGPVVRNAHSLGRRILNSAQRSAPVDNGIYRASLDFTVHSGPAWVQLRIGSDLDYAEYIVRGTGIYGPHRTPIVPVRRKFLKFKPKGSSTYVFARSVKGTPPDDHLIDALREHVRGPIIIHR